MSGKLFKRLMSVISAGTIGVSMSPIDLIVHAADIETTQTTITGPIIKNETETVKSSDILTGDANLDGIVNADDSTFLADAITGGTTDKLKHCDVDFSEVIDQTDADMIASYFTGEITYFPVGKIYNPEAKYITRAEWIHSLATGFEMSVEDESTMEYYFTDLEDCEYAFEIELAANFGVFDVLGDEFNPDEYVTRDFAAHTMNYCLGYSNDVPLFISDASSIYYAGDAQVAVNRGWFEVVDENFCPSMYVSVNEYNLIFEDMTNVLNEAKVDVNHNNEIKYSDKVIIINDAEDIFMDNEIVVIQGSSISLNDGDNIAFTVNDIEMLRKITSCILDGPDTYRITTEEPDADCLVSCSIEGKAYVDDESINVLPEARSILYDSFGVSNKRASETISQGDRLLDGSIPFNDTSLELKGLARNLEVYYSYHHNNGAIQHMSFEVRGDIELSASLKAKLAVTSSGSIDIVEFTVVGLPSIISANVVISAVASVSGEISLTYRCYASGGFAYTKGEGVHAIKNFQSKGFTLKATAEEKIGVKVGLNARVFGSEVARIYLGLGERGKIETLADTASDVVCTNLSAWLYCEIGYKLNIPFLKEEDSCEFININNSPLRVNIHLENGEIVNKCINGLEHTTVSDIAGGGSYGGGASGGYVSGYGYGSGYVTGTHGPSWVGKYYSSTIAFKELEPAMVIEEDRMLTSDLEIDTDIIIRAKLDLNGYKFTAKRNVTIQGTEASLIINKGTAIIEGNLYALDESSIVMQTKDDKITVNGNASFNGHFNMTAGIMQLNGDINGDSIYSSDIHTLILGGTVDQNITASVNVNVLDIKNSDERKIIVDKSLYAESSTTVDGTTLHLLCNESNNNESYFRPARLNVEKLLIDGNISLGYIEFKGKEIIINGDLINSESITLAKAAFSITGNASTIGDFSLGGSVVTVGGNYKHEGFLYMNNMKDKLYVGGDLHLAGTGDSIQDGIIDVKGDIRFTHIIYTYIFERYNWLGGNNKVILSGEDDVAIYMDGGNFNIIEFNNSGDRQLYMDSRFEAVSIECGENPLNIAARNSWIKLGYIECTEMNVDGNCTINGFDDLKFNCDSINFNDDVEFSEGTINFSGVPVTIDGDMIAQCPIYLSGSSINANNITIKSGLYFNKGNVYAQGDFTINDGGLYMEDDRDKLTIIGDFIISRNEYREESINAGTIECTGDIIATGDCACIQASGSSKFILNGTDDQIIRIVSIMPFFNKLNIANSDNRKIILKGALNASELTSDSGKISITSEGGYILNAKLLSDLDIVGNLILTGDAWWFEGEFDLNGYTINLDGDFYHNAATLAVNSGKLYVAGDYRMVRNEDSAVYEISDGILSMRNIGDKVCIEENFITMTSVDHTDYLTAGTLEIKGDFYQYDDGTTYAFPASGKHMTILSGDEVQNVIFESYDDSHFNILHMEQTEDKYVFSDNPCWNELADMTTTATTPISTTTITTTTVTVPDTTTETVPTTTNKTTTKSTTTTATTTSKATTTISSKTNPVEIIISNTTATKGENVSISIDIENNPGLSNAEFDVAFDSECLEFIDAQSGDAMADTEFSCDISEDGTLHISFTGEGNNNGTMAVLNFNVLKTPEDSKASVTIVDDSAKITDLNGENVEIEVIYDEGTESNAGDVNNDGEIDLKDVVLIRRFIAGGWDVELDTETADVNNDDEVDLKDVVLIRRYIAGGWDVELA